MGALQFKTTAVSDALLPEGTSQLYQGHVVKSDAISYEDLVAQVADTSKVAASTVLGVLTAFNEKMLACLADGIRPTWTGLFSTRFLINGGFAAEDSAWDPERNSIGVAFVIGDQLKNKISGIIPSNVLPKVAIQILGVQDATTAEQDRLTKGNTCLIQGKYVKIDTAKTDEGVYLVNGTNAYKCTVSASTAATVDFTLPADIPVGDDYEIQVRGRNGYGVNRSLVVARLQGISVVAAA